MKRTRSDHLTDDEKALIRKRHDERAPIKDVARELNCTPRNIQKYYSMFEGRYPGSGGKRSRMGEPYRVIKDQAPKAKVNRASRFYKSDFEPN